MVEQWNSGTVVEEQWNRYGGTMMVEQWNRYSGTVEQLNSYGEKVQQ